MTICPVCRTPIPHNALLCAQCGAVFPKPQAVLPPAENNKESILRTQQAGNTYSGISVPSDAMRNAADGDAQGAHSVVHAVLLSLAATGFGQIYNKQVGKGAAVMGMGILLVLSCVGLAFSDWLKALILFALGAILLIAVATLDAALIARRLQRGETISKWQCF